MHVKIDPNLMKIAFKVRLRITFVRSCMFLIAMRRGCDGMIHVWVTILPPRRE